MWSRCVGKLGRIWHPSPGDRSVGGLFSPDPPLPPPEFSLLKTNFITNACLPPVEPTDGRGAGGKGGGTRSRLADRAGPIRAGSVAAPRECRAQPAWSRGHSSRDRSRGTPRIQVQLDRYSGAAQSIYGAHRILLTLAEVEAANDGSSLPACSGATYSAYQCGFRCRAK